MSVMNELLATWRATRDPVLVVQPGDVLPLAIEFKDSSLGRRVGVTVGQVYSDIWAGHMRVASARVMVVG